MSTTRLVGTSTSPREAADLEGAGLLTVRPLRTYVRPVPRVSRLTPERLDSLYNADDFGGEKTMRAKAIRELIDEIRELRREQPGTATDAHRAGPT